MEIVLGSVSVQKLRLFKNLSNQYFSAGTTKQAQNNSLTEHLRQCHDRDYARNIEAEFHFLQDSNEYRVQLINR